MKLRKINKKGFEMSFAWIFSLIVGAAILIIAVYFTIKFIQTSTHERDTESAAKISSLLDSLETGLEEGKSSAIVFPSETRVYNKCLTTGNFGKHSLSISEKTGIGKEWPEPGGDTQIYNKYIFSDSVEQGKEFSVFAKPFRMPFKVSDLIFLSANDYCFINPPGLVEDEIQGLGIENIKLTNNPMNCSENSISVCFNSPGCNISVSSSGNFDQGSVVKEGRTMNYVGPLIYGAIFASPEVYECNYQRLMLRLINLALIYKDKLKITEKVGCGGGLNAELSVLITLSRAKTSQGIAMLRLQADEIDRLNNAARCKLY